jgi:hypothetical protein
LLEGIEQCAVVMPTRATTAEFSCIAWRHAGLLQLVEEALDLVALVIDRLLPAKLGIPLERLGMLGTAP